MKFLSKSNEKETTFSAVHISEISELYNLVTRYQKARISLCTFFSIFWTCGKTLVVLKEFSAGGHKHGRYDVDTKFRYDNLRWATVRGTTNGQLRRLEMMVANSTS